MASYRTIVVGTDGSESSYRAVEKAALIASATSAKLIIACAYHPVDGRNSGADADVLKDDAYQIIGSSPTEEILRTARELAKGIGATDIEERAIVGNPVDSLISLVHDVNSDLLVVGNKGLNSLAGRLLGSVPADAARKAGTDVLIAHTV